MSLLVTLIFLLASGAPAKRAMVTCGGIATFEAGNDFEMEHASGGALVVDSRGAVAVMVDAPVTITCTATFGTERFHGPIVIRKSGQVTRLSLKDDTHAE
jgi:hypothetical protein